MKLSYESIIDSSTNNFQKRHLILDEDIRLHLQMRCNVFLGYNLPKRKLEFNMGDVFSKLVSDACGPYALDRLKKLADQGRFETDVEYEYGCEFGYGSEFESGYESGYVPIKYSDKNTIIVACTSSETILLHIKQGKTSDLLFKIEKISNLDQHLQWNGDGKIYHYKS